MEHEKAMLEVLEGIKCEMKLQNKLMAHDMMENKQNSIADIIKIEDSAYEDLRRKKEKKNDVKSKSGGKLSSFQTNGNGGYLNSSTNNMLNAALDGFNKGTRKEGMENFIRSLAWQIHYGKITEENALRIAKNAAQNSSPPLDLNEAVAIWNDVMSKPLN